VHFVLTSLSLFASIQEPAMPHISSMAPLRFALLNGQLSPDPYIAAFLNVGGREEDGSVPQFGLCGAGRQAAHGRLTWDADHARSGSTSPFFSVAPVRLEVKPTGECLLAVGTADYVRLQTRPYRWIERVQVAARAGTRAPDRAIRWDLIEVVFCYTDGRTETCKSNCLPAVATGTRVRRAAQAPDVVAVAGRLPGQYAEVATGSREVAGIKLRGQVTLRANEGQASPAVPLCPEDLQGQIAIFTDASVRDD
jgi:hypothetical protein